MSKHLFSAIEDQGPNERGLLFARVVAISLDQRGLSVVERFTRCFRIREGSLYMAAPYSKKKRPREAGKAAPWQLPSKQWERRSGDTGARPLSPDNGCVTNTPPGKGADMEFIVVINAQSPFGMRLLAMKGKIGGASEAWDFSGVAHPVIVCADLDWSIPGVMQCSHLQDPFVQDMKPCRVLVPASTVLFAVQLLRDPSGQETKQEQSSGDSLLH